MQLPGAGSEGMASSLEAAPGATWVWPLAFALAVVFAFGVGGLSVVDSDGGTDISVRETLVATAADATAKAGSSQVALDIKTDALDGTRPTHVEITGAGAFDYTVGEGHIDQHLSGATVPPD